MTTELPGMKKITALVDEEVYNTIQNKLHHGQPTELFRAIINELARIINTESKAPIMKWMYIGGSLMLAEREENKQ